MKKELIEIQTPVEIPTAAPVISPDERKKQRDLELVRGKFLNIERPNGKLYFTYRIPYKDQEAKNYEMMDGEVYTIPRDVARHLNTSGSFPVHEYVNDASGRPVSKYVRDMRRYNFQSLEFFDDEDYAPKKILLPSF